MTRKELAKRRTGVRKEKDWEREEHRRAFPTTCSKHRGKDFPVKDKGTVFLCTRKEGGGKVKLEV